MLTVGIDIGGTKIAGGVVDDAGEFVEKARVVTPADPRALEDAVVAMIRDLHERHDIAAVGVAAAGFIDRDRAVLHYAPNIAWRDEPLRDLFVARTGLKTVIENDANAAGWAEFRYGAGRGTSHMVMITLGTGVGGAIIADGALYRGGFGAAGELGHTRFVRDGLQCGCGLRGCLEQYASGRALQRAANEVADAGGLGTALAAARQERGKLSGRTISELVLAGDPGALEALRTVAVALGEACGSFQATLDPELFVIGGGVAQLGEALLRPARTAYEASVPTHGQSPMARFAIAELVNDAGVIGAADLAREAA